MPAATTGRPAKPASGARLPCASQRNSRSRRPGVIFELEELRSPETEGVGDEQVRKPLLAVVVEVDGAVVVAARVLDLVLRVRQLSLQLEEIAAGLEVRVRLDQRH